MEQDSAASSVTGDNLNVNETNEDVEDSDQGPKFCPPLYRQRYQFVGRVLEENNALRVSSSCRTYVIIYCLRSCIFWS